MQMKIILEGSAINLKYQKFIQMVHNSVSFGPSTHQSTHTYMDYRATYVYKHIDKET